MTSSKELEVDVEADCGNAPSKAQGRDWLITLAEGDVDAACQELATDVSWDVAGQERHDGIDDVRSHVEQLTEDSVEQLTISHLLSHGKQVAAEGSTNRSRFAHVITYTGHGKTAKIAEIVSYIMPR